MNSLAAIVLKIALSSVAERKLNWSFGDICIFSLHGFNCSLSDFFFFFNKQTWSSPEDCCSYHAGILIIFKKRKHNKNKTLLWRQITLIETICTDDWQTEN